MPSSAKPIPIEPRIRYFQAASIACGVRLKPTSSADTIVVASIPTQTSPRLSTSGTAASPAANHGSSA